MTSEAKKNKKNVHEIDDLYNLFQRTDSKKFDPSKFLRKIKKVLEVYKESLPKFQETGVLRNAVDELLKKIREEKISKGQKKLKGEKKIKKDFNIASNPGGYNYGYGYT